MTPAEFSAKSLEIDRHLKAAGFCPDWIVLFGVMIGQLGLKLGWEATDEFLMDFVAVCQLLHSRPDLQSMMVNRGK